MIRPSSACGDGVRAGGVHARPPESGGARAPEHAGVWGVGYMDKTKFHCCTSEDPWPSQSPAHSNNNWSLEHVRPCLAPKLPRSAAKRLAQSRAGPERGEGPRPRASFRPAPRQPCAAPPLALQHRLLESILHHKLSGTAALRAFGVLLRCAPAVIGRPSGPSAMLVCSRHVGSSVHSSSPSPPAVTNRGGLGSELGFCAAAPGAADGNSGAGNVGAGDGLQGSGSQAAKVEGRRVRPTATSRPGWGAPPPAWGWPCAKRRMVFKG